MTILPPQLGNGIGVQADWGSRDVTDVPATAR